MSMEKIRKVQCRGSDCGSEVARTGSSGERDFLSERLSLFARAVFFASGSFFLAGFVIYRAWPGASQPAPSLTHPVILFHLAAITVFLVLWLATRQPGLSEPALRRLDGGATVLGILLHVGMTANMPVAWRH